MHTRPSPRTHGGGQVAHASVLVVRNSHIIVVKLYSRSSAAVGTSSGSSAGTGAGPGAGPCCPPCPLPAPAPPPPDACCSRRAVGAGVGLRGGGCVGGGWGARVAGCALSSTRQRRCSTELVAAPGLSSITAPMAVWRGKGGGGRQQAELGGRSRQQAASQQSSSPFGSSCCVEENCLAKHDWRHRTQASYAQVPSRMLLCCVALRPVCMTAAPLTCSVGLDLRQVQCEVCGVQRVPHHQRIRQQARRRRAIPHRRDARV